MSDDDDVVVQDAPVKNPAEPKLTHLQRLQDWLEEKLDAVKAKIEELTKR